MEPDDLSRIAKFFLDERGLHPDEARRRLAGHGLALACGPEVATSPTLQAAVLTAANTAARCFPGAVTLHLPDGDGPPVSVLWSQPVGLGRAVTEVAPGVCVHGRPVPADVPAVVAFGSRPDIDRGLQVTFDGWAAAVGPVAGGVRLGERERCVLAGVAAGALAVSETFLAFAGVSVEAMRRSVGLSLWRPDLPWDHPDAVGDRVEYLPGEAWCLGLGHLGQAYLWCLGLLPYAEPDRVNLILHDFDTVVPANLDTGLLTRPDHLGRFKTRVSAAWLEARGFRPRLVERAFDEETHRRNGEPLLGLCGFDGSGPRHLLDRAGFEYVVECGLGGTASNFDALLAHTLPIDGRPCTDIWPAGEPGADRRRVEELADKDEVYHTLGPAGRCGRLELAGRSVAVPFVGAVAGSVVLAECLRMQHEGERYEAVDLRLSSPARMRARRAAGGYRGVRQPRASALRCGSVTRQGLMRAG